tara:strand:+ start:1618 stop:1917 length:300 start_codon:yes stop_codon:yes gene_type:complete
MVSYKYYRAPEGHSIITEYRIGDLVYTVRDYDDYSKKPPLKEGIGIIKNIRYYYKTTLHESGYDNRTGICEMEVYWTKTTTITYEMERNILPLKEKLNA